MHLEGRPSAWAYYERDSDEGLLLLLRSALFLRAASFELTFCSHSFFSEQVIPKKAVKGKEQDVMGEMEVLKDLNHPNIVSLTAEQQGGEEEEGARAQQRGSMLLSV